MAYLQVMTTTGSQAAAMELASGLVQARLAACVQVVGPVHSVYRWQGQVHTDTEWQCLAKTTQARLDELIAYLRASHGYDLPEIIATPIVGGSADYLRWLDEQTTPAT